ncbi:hypothetical protein [Sulfuricurvum sp.]|uniref:hypothetical protein n=1 Tax=Sulfuricurvum sp. TaxID=2025608 RepID=UPI003BB65356
MHGKIFEYNSNTQSGLIIDVYQNTYRFVLEEYKDSTTTHIAGANVEFNSDGNIATDIHLVFANQQTNQSSSSGSKMVMMLTLIIGIGSFVAVMIYSELERKNIKEVQNFYHAQIKKIEGYLEAKNCVEALDEYKRARETRHKVDEQGLYYSIEPFAIQAHAIDIAECYAQSEDYESTIKILDTEDVRNADYLRKASEIYNSIGEKEKAQEVKLKADKYEQGQ